MGSAFGPEFDCSWLGVKMACESADETEKLGREYRNKKFNDLMERAKDGTATREELRANSIHPVTDAEMEDEYGRSIVPSGGIFFPRVSEEIADKYKKLYR